MPFPSHLLWCSNSGAVTGPSLVASPLLRETQRGKWTRPRQRWWSLKVQRTLPHRTTEWCQYRRIRIGTHIVHERLGGKQGQEYVIWSGAHSYDMLSAGYSNSYRNGLRTCFGAPMSPSRERQIGVAPQRQGFEKIGRRRASTRVPFWDDVSGVRKKRGVRIHRILGNFGFLRMKDWSRYVKRDVINDWIKTLME